MFYLYVLGFYFAWMCYTPCSWCTKNWKDLMDYCEVNAYPNQAKLTDSQKQRFRTFDARGNIIDFNFRD